MRKVLIDFELLEKTEAAFNSGLSISHDSFIRVGIRAALASPVVQQPLTDERKAAEYEYSITAHNYPDAPLGSRDWTLYWAGWLARSTAHGIGGQQP